MKTNFFPNKLALFTLIAACFVVNVSMGVRQTFGLFSNNFEIDCGITNTEFGLAVALQDHQLSLLSLFSNILNICT